MQSQHRDKQETNSGLLIQPQKTNEEPDSILDLMVKSSHKEFNDDHQIVEEEDLGFEVAQNQQNKLDELPQHSISKPPMPVTDGEIEVQKAQQFVLYSDEHFAMDVFMHFDKDNSQFLCEQEFLQARRLFGINNVIGCPSIVDKWSHNTNGLTFEEFHEFLKQNQVLWKSYDVSRQLYKKKHCCLTCYGCYCAKSKEEEGKCTKTCLCKKMRNDASKNRLKIAKGWREITASKEAASALIIALTSSRFLALYDIFQDVRYMLKAYWMSQEPENQLNLNYKIVVLVSFFSILSPYWITYSGLLSIQNAKGLFTKGEESEKSCLKSVGYLGKFLYLSFIGPCVLLCGEIINAIGDLCLIPLTLVACCNGPKVFKMKEQLKIWHSWMLSVDQYKVDGILALQSTAQIFFQDLPMLILFSLVSTGVLKTSDKLMKEPAYLTWGKTLPIFIYHFYMIYLQSKAGGERMITFCLENMTGRISWIPHLDKIQYKKGPIELDFGSLKTNYPYLSGVMGLFVSVEFQFTPKTLQILATKLKSSISLRRSRIHPDKKSRIRIQGACETLSIKDILHFISQQDLDTYDFLFSVKDIDKMIKNNIRQLNRAKSQDEDEKTILDVLKADSYTKLKPLVFCVDNCPDSDEKKWLCQTIFQRLIHHLEEAGNKVLELKFKKQCMFHALKTKKKRMIRLMLMLLKSDLDLWNTQYDQSILGYLIKKVEDLDLLEFYFRVLKTRMDETEILNMTLSDTLIHPNRLSLFKYFIIQNLKHGQLDLEFRDFFGREFLASKIQSIMQAETKTPFQEVNLEHKTDLRSLIWKIIIIESTQTRQIVTLAMLKKFPQKVISSILLIEPQLLVIVVNEALKESDQIGALQKYVQKLAHLVFSTQEISDLKLRLAASQSEIEDRNFLQPREWSRKDQTDDGNYDELINENQNDDDQDCIKTLAAKSETQVSLILSLILENLAMADLFSDGVLIYFLANSQHTMWLCFHVMTIMWPYFVAQVPYTNLKITNYRQHIFKRRGESTRWQDFMAIGMITPSLFIYLIFMDLIILAFNILLTIPIFILVAFNCKNATEKIMDLFDNLNNVLFDLEKIQMEGFRRMRTSSQLTFESIPQIMIQLYIFWRISQDDEDEEDLGITLGAIGLSIAFALAHGVLEFLLIYWEAKATRSEILDYLLTSFTGRFGWVPFSDHLTQNQSKVDVNFDAFSQRICCDTLTIDVEYTFTESTLQNLTKTISQIPPNQVPIQQRHKVRVGKCMEGIQLSTFLNFVKESTPRLFLDISKVDNFTWKYEDLLKQSFALTRMNYKQIFQLLPLRMRNFDFRYHRNIFGEDDILEYSLRLGNLNAAEFMLTQPSVFVLGVRIGLAEEWSTDYPEEDILQTKILDSSNSSLLINYLGNSVFKVSQSMMALIEEHVRIKSRKNIYGEKRKMIIFGLLYSSRDLEERNAYFAFVPDSIKLKHGEKRYMVSKEQALRFRKIRFALIKNKAELEESADHCIDIDELMKDYTKSYSFDGLFEKLKYPDRIVDDQEYEYLDKMLEAKEILQMDQDQIAFTAENEPNYYKKVSETVPIPEEQGHTLKFQVPSNFIRFTKISVTTTQPQECVFLKVQVLSRQAGFPFKSTWISESLQTRPTQDNRHCLCELDNQAEEIHPTMLDFYYGNINEMDYISFTLLNCPGYAEVTFDYVQDARQICLTQPVLLNILDTKPNLFSNMKDESSDDQPQQVLNLVRDCQTTPHLTAVQMFYETQMNYLTKAEYESLQKLYKYFNQRDCKQSHCQTNPLYVLLVSLEMDGSPEKGYSQVNAFLSKLQLVELSEKCDLCIKSLTAGLQGVLQSTLNKILIVLSAEMDNARLQKSNWFKFIDFVIQRIFEIDKITISKVYKVQMFHNKIQTQFNTETLKLKKKDTTESIPDFSRAVAISMSDVLITGGFQSAKACIYSVDTQQVKHVTPMNQERSCHELVLLSGSPYAIGGQAKGYLRTMERYNIQQDTWTDKASFNILRFGFSAASISEYLIYIFGGWNGKTVHDTIERYSRIKDEWEIISIKLPEPLWGLSAVRIDNTEIILTGGKCGSNISNKVISFHYKNMEGQMRELAPMSAKRYNHFSFFANNTVYVMGGQKVQPGEAQVFESYKVSQGTWGKLEVGANELGEVIDWKYCSALTYKEIK